MWRPRRRSKDEEEKEGLRSSQWHGRGQQQIRTDKEDQAKDIETEECKDDRFGQGSNAGT